ncbi:methionyl-tRNA formyltransferase [Longitalea arenae]|uniref:methionyl-tRNA formyltransferase n=1 Tax=Longitalea arenae TaxID=2812558 RepID=UPI001966F9C0|nr:formyltransferase family protein [Longitalea arenae]
MRTGIVSNSTLCLPLLNYLRSAGEDLIVYSAEPAVYDKGAVAAFCAGAGITCMHEKSSGQSVYDWAAAEEPDIVFVIGYDRIIRTNRLATVMPHIYNVHFGHLPEYRGPNPVFWQLKNSAPTLAITIHRINERLDAGPIAWTKEYANEAFFSYGYVHQLMSYYLVEGVNHLLQLKKQAQPIPVKEQDERRSAYFKRPKIQEVCISWPTMSATAICNLVRACNPWNNGAISFYNGFEVRISDAEPVDHPAIAHRVPDPIANGRSGNDVHLAGTILDTSPSLMVACNNNEAINIHTLIVNGILMPGRFAANYGFIKGQLFSNI